MSSVQFGQILYHPPVSPQELAAMFPRKRSAVLGNPVGRSTRGPGLIQTDVFEVRGRADRARYAQLINETADRSGRPVGRIQLVYDPDTPENPLRLAIPRHQRPSTHQLLAAADFLATRAPEDGRSFLPLIATELFTRPKATTSLPQVIQKLAAILT
jgi:hypothetical protein